MKARVLSMALIPAMSLILAMGPGCSNEDKSPSDATVKQGIAEVIKKSGNFPFEIEVANYKRLDGKELSFGPAYKVVFDADIKAVGTTCVIRHNSFLFSKRGKGWRPGGFFESVNKNNDTIGMWDCVDMFRKASARLK